MSASRDEVIAWMKANGAGYKRAAEHFGLPRDTVKTWGRENRGSGARPRARAKRAERDEPEPPPKAPPEPPAEPPEWDPTKQTRREWLVERIRECLAARDVAMRQEPPHGGVARQWEVTAGGYHDQLTELEAEARADEEAKGRSSSAMASPEDLARRVLRQLPALVAVVPDEARKVHAELGRLLER